MIFAVRRNGGSRTEDWPLPRASRKWALRVIHELQVHQIELEMQNEELLLAQAAVQRGVQQVP